MIGVLLWVACARQAPCGAAGTAAAATGDQNVLVVLLDDVGVDQIDAYGVGTLTAPTPTLDCLCERGVRFDRAWAAPLCSPGRAALMTGRGAFATGIGDNIGPADQLDPAEVTLGEVAKLAGYHTGYVGKWHLDGWDSPNGVDGPELQGFDTFRGTLANLRSPSNPPAPAGSHGGYRGYWRLDQGQLGWERRYATTVDVDDALRFVREADGAWLLVVAVHGAHAPLDPPPAKLLTDRLPDRPTDGQAYRAVLEATDAEIGRLLRGIDPDTLARTTVFLTSDNGTSTMGVVPPLDPGHAKGTAYQGGLSVPLVVAGPAVRLPGSSSAALVSVADLLPTVAELLEVEAPADLDGESLVPLLADPRGEVRSTLTMAWTPAGAEEVVVRDQRYKLASWADGSRSLFDLELDPGETRDLLLEPLDADAASELLALGR